MEFCRSESNIRKSVLNFAFPRLTVNRLLDAVDPTGWTNYRFYSSLNVPQFKSSSCVKNS